MIFQNWLEELSHYNLLSLSIFFLIENLILLFLSIIIGKIIEYGNTKLSKADRKWIIATLICNTLITLSGYELYASGIIKIDFLPTILSVLSDTLLLIFLMDFSMFCFHYLAHHIKWFYPVHKLHHTHIETSVYSLFVLHPIETLGFGSIWLFLISIFEFNYISIIIYLILNLLYGIFGHLKTDVFPEFWYKSNFTKWISTTKFHSNHHKNESHNFGFYFTIWDKIFKTII
ncbi:sterol desaturase family protein [Flavobacterium piscis]|uniref:Sterol desaturase/sphingolipid hydroxylase (Fatty acid hydroxylase superfamily) n=1 Tax=Flavobacterium piscis TaxID=1114874 RepID=A0ABU1YBB5_9FLAO|nr:sterol desaturase family protein [Flavobacterium piscis]MDR7210736.1 sterol desaturase/sphingolipid hydroxylase (fatty acid hydroxylase superfamily) [Flavobacterium piscis]